MVIFHSYVSLPEGKAFYRIESYGDLGIPHWSQDFVLHGPLDMEEG